MTTGEKIRFYRKLNHMTLEELVDKCGVQKSVVAKWEKDLVDIETLTETLGHKKRADSALFTRPNRQFVWCGRCAIEKGSTGFHRYTQNQGIQGRIGILPYHSLTHFTTN